MTRVLGAWVPALVWAAVIFAASSRPRLPVDLELGLDKVAHFGAYTVLGLALAHGQLRSGWPWAAALLLGLLYAASDELHQSLVPGRSPDLADWIADAFGTGAGVLLYHRWHRRRPGGTRRRADAAPHSFPT